ncbi:LxmA leader domain family RiPP [Rhodococcus rhodnii]|uniref:LxmA leader domain family RiPP n=1 Tax=Rhodococcus rhodnii TaxID=38312 RepID=UPI003530B994
MALSDGYRMYTTDDELAAGNVSGVAAPATTPVLVPLLLRATLIAQKSSQQCAISLAGGTPNVKKTIQSVC